MRNHNSIYKYVAYFNRSINHHLAHTGYLGGPTFLTSFHSSYCLHTALLENYIRMLTTLCKYVLHCFIDVLHNLNATFQWTILATSSQKTKGELLAKLRLSVDFHAFTLQHVAYVGEDVATIRFSRMRSISIALQAAPRSSK